VEDVTLILGGKRWTGWTSVTVEASITAAARSWSVTPTTLAPDDAGTFAAAPGTAVQLLAGDDPLVTGYVESHGIDETATSLGLSLGGRSKTLRLIKCSHLHPTCEARRITHYDLAADLAQPFGVGVVSLVGDGEVIDRIRIQAGEPPFEVIERLAREWGVLVSDTGDGDLLLVRAGQGRGDDLVYGSAAVTSWRYAVSSADRYTEYKCVGQRRGTDAQYAAAVAACKATAYDYWTTDREPLLVRAEGEVDDAACLRRARWEAASRAGRATTLTVTERGWRYADGTLKEPNVLRRVNWPRAGLDGDLLVVSTAFSLDKQDGERVEQVLAPASGYDPEPPTKRDREQARNRKAKATKSNGASWLPDWTPEED